MLCINHHHPVAVVAQTGAMQKLLQHQWQALAFALAGFCQLEPDATGQLQRVVSKGSLQEIMVQVVQAPGFQELHWRRMLKHHSNLVSESGLIHVAMIVVLLSVAGFTMDLEKWHSLVHRVLLLRRIIMGLNKPPPLLQLNLCGPESSAAIAIV